ncbi:DNA-binding protein [Heliocybe sulcata]|uniref:DNA-binding protein n=1 Tax=Heliocybe sulcata TaxID=5364 RepID=A0A5C3NAH5_9AGAM|nr:DNA-binding protein [Heliocybe sulcata]
MQAQSTRTSQTQLTADQSLACVQTLLRAGLGCITYLRNLLPADNFSESYLMTSSNESTSQSIDSHASFSSDCSSRRNISGFKIMTVTRGFTEEADKLLDFLENGIFDALQKQYLRSFIFAVYLDQQDPNNIVEAYTFNFNYYKPPGSDAAIPIMSLGDDLMKMSLNQCHGEDADPVAEAIKQGKTPTLGEVKRSVKTLVKNLIQATTQMDALPRRRYATFKLFYHDHTPDDYEPPHFRAGDLEKDKWYFATHDKREMPEKCSVGRLETGWHGVDVRIASVSAYLPSREDNSAAFAGTCGPSAKGAPSLTPAEEAASRAQENELQVKDAEKRCIIWDAEDGLTDMDAEGDDDPDYLPPGKANAETVEPLGIRNETGDIIPINVDAAGDIPETQPLSFTQQPCEEQRMDLEETSPARSPSLPPSDLTGDESDDTLMPTSEGHVDTLMLMDNLAAGKSAVTEDLGDSEMLDLETQAIPQCSFTEDPIESFGGKAPTASPGRMSLDEKVADEVLDKGLDCDCGVQLEEEDQCWCNSCGVWGMGSGSLFGWCDLTAYRFHSAKDKRLPVKFSCFDCRVKADQNWDLIVVHDLYPSMIAKFKDLALFRRAVKLAEERDPESLSEFCKIIGCEAAVAGQLFKRLEAEGILKVSSPRGHSTDCIQVSLKSKAKGKQAKRKNLQKKSYRFVRSSKRSVAYHDYFSPDPDVEKRILGLSELSISNNILPPPGAYAGSQTQAETQIMADPALALQDKDLKRKLRSSDDQPKLSKKVKISVVSGVDLGD